MPFFGGGGSSSGGSGSQTTYPVLSGSGAPGASLGSNGQIYIDTSTNTLYGPKTGGSWGSGMVLTGADYSEITNLPTTFTPATHAHVIADVTDLQTELDGKTATGHAHVIADVTNLQTELDGKTATGHAHVIADVTDLQTTLDAKATVENLSYEVTSLIDSAPDDLDTLNKLAEAINDDPNYNTTITALISAKAASTHNHTVESLSNISGNLGVDRILKYNGQNWEMVLMADPGDSLQSLSDVSSVSPTDGYYLRYSSTSGTWYGSPVAADFSSAVGNLVMSPQSGTIEVRGFYTTTGNHDISAAIQLNCGMNTHAVKIQGPPHSANASYTLVLPDDVGSAGQVLQTDGTGELSWLTVGGSGNSVTFSSVPATETSTGAVGEMALDALHLYVCVATNSWKRIELQDFSGNTGGGGGSTTGIFISQQPTGGASQNGSFTLSIQATVPSGSVSYQWQKKSGSTWSDVVGGVYASLSLSALTSTNNGDKYRCYLTATGHSDVISNEATVSVTESGVSGVTSTKPSVTFDRSNSLDFYPYAIFKGTGKNWSYSGWDLIKEESVWQYSYDNGHTANDINGAASYPSRSGDWNYYLTGVPPIYQDSWDDYLDPSFQYYERNMWYVTGGYETPVMQGGAFINIDPPFTHDTHTNWRDTASDDGKWNRSARFATRVVLTRTVNGVEEQVTTNYSEWSDWRSDPAGNILLENQPTVFTTQPSSSITFTPSAGLTSLRLQDTAEVAGTNKRYLWNINGGYNFGSFGLRDRILIGADSQFESSLDVTIDYIVLGAAGTHNINCLGASDWNFAADSTSSGTLVIKAHDDTQMRQAPNGTEPQLVITKMDGYVSSSVNGHKLFYPRFEFSAETLHGGSYAVKDYSILGTDRDLTSNDGYFVGASESATLQKKIQIRIQKKDAYGVGTGAWEDFATTTLYYAGSNNVPLMGYGDGSVQIGNDAFRWAYRLVNLDVHLSTSGDATDQTRPRAYENLNTVWSPWIYES